MDTKQQLKKVAHSVAELSSNDSIVSYLNQLTGRKTTSAWKRPRNYIMAIFGLGATLIMFKDTITGMFKPAKTDAATAHDIARD